MTDFDLERFRSRLTTQDVGRKVVYLQTVETTMTLARDEAAAGSPHGTVVLAEEQTAGRGRKGRSFSSPAGENLYFTLVLRCPLEVHRRLPAAIPLAVLTAIRIEGVDAGIKWPNDIWADGLKVCGMLIDAEITDGGAIAYPGIGINVNGDPSLLPGLAGIATSLRVQLGRPVDREVLLARICNELEVAMALPAAEMATRYRERSLVIGRAVLVTPLKGEPYAAEATGITDDGSLVVRTADGAVSDLNAAEVTLRPSRTASQGA